MKNISLWTLLFMFMTTACGVSAHYFSKRGTQNIHALKDFISVDIMVAVMFYALSTFSYLLVLRKVPLSTAYPLFSVSFVLILIVGHFCFHETISAYKILGVVLIILGIFCIAFGEYKVSSGSTKTADISINPM